MKPGQKHGGIVHGKGCACPLCDPKQIRLAAAAEAARNGAASSGISSIPSAQPRPPARNLTLERLKAAVRRGDRDPRTIRLRALLREGKSFREANEIIDREFSKPITGGLHDGIEKIED